LILNTELVLKNQMHYVKKVNLNKLTTHVLIVVLIVDIVLVRILTNVLLVPLNTCTQKDHVLKNANLVISPISKK